jgi:hypothetical protein
METIFKVGMEVWDKTISPNKGKVIEVLEDTKFDFPIKVEFDDGLKIQYTNKGCFVKSKGAISTLSSSDYSLELEGFEQKAPAPTYEDIVKERNYIYLPENLVAPNKELADAVVALLKLLFLRDYYNEGWQPDWKDNNWKHFILFDEGNLANGSNKSSCRVLFFKSEKVRNKFLEEQRELLEIAKPLL